MKKRVSTWGFPGVTETHSMQPCCRSSAMRGRMWRATLTEQFSDASMGKSQKSEWMCLCLTEQLGLEWKKTMQQQTAEDKREKEGGFNSKREIERKWWWLLRENEEERNKQKRRRLKSSGAENAKQQQQQLQHYQCHFSSPSLLLFSSLCCIFCGYGDAHTFSIYFLCFYDSLFCFFNIILFF